MQISNIYYIQYATDRKIFFFFLPCVFPSGLPSYADTNVGKINNALCKFPVLKQFWSTHTAYVQTTVNKI